MGFIPTTQTEKAKELLQEKMSLVIKGNPGEGKTSTALHLIDNVDYINRRVVVQSPEQWTKVDTNSVDIVVLDDIFGKYDLNPVRLQEWIDYHLMNIQNHVDVGKLRVIIITRNDILLKTGNKLKSFKLFSTSMSLTLSSETLTKSDKKSILNKRLQKNTKVLNDDKVEQCVANFGGLIGFPQCCCLFVMNNDFFCQGPEFFKSPENFLCENIRNLVNNGFLPLAFLFCNVKIEEEYLSPSPFQQSENYLVLLKELTSCLNISFNDSTINSLRDLYEHFSGLYVYKKMEMHKSCSGRNVRKSCIYFLHSTVYEAVGQVLGEISPEMVVKYGDSGYIYQKTYTAEPKHSASQSVFIPVSVHEMLVKRMIHDVVEKGLIGSVVKCSSLKQEDFLMKLKDVLHKDNKTMEFLMAKPYSVSRFDQNAQERECDLSEGWCTTSMQYILQSDEDVVRLLFGQFLEFLECSHIKRSDCWQCEEKQKLLQLALYYNHFEIADKLISMNACYTHVSLCNAAIHGDLRRVQTILQYLKSSQVFSPACKEAKKALYRVLISDNQSLIKLLLQEQITLESWHVVDVVKHKNINALIKVVEHLKDHDKWNPHCEQETTNLEQDMPLDREWTDFSYSSVYLSNIKPLPYSEIPCIIALYIAYCNETFDMADYLLRNNVKLSRYMLPRVAKYGSKQAVERVIQNLKESGTWDPQCNTAFEASVIAYVGQKYDVYDMLTHEGVSFTLKDNLSLLLESQKTIGLHFEDIWSHTFQHIVTEVENNVINNVIGSFKSFIETLPNIFSESSPSLLIFDITSKLTQPWKSIWDPDRDDAFPELSNTMQAVYDMCELVQDELIDMLYLQGFFARVREIFRKLQQYLNEIDQTCCAYVQEVLFDKVNNSVSEIFDWRDLLAESEDSVTMKQMVLRSLDDMKAHLTQLKDNPSWDPACNNASEALEVAFSKQKYDVCDLLVQEGISLRMNNLVAITRKFLVSLESAKKIIQHLKDTENWDPKCNEASEALHNSYKQYNYDLYDLLVDEGVSLTMENFPEVILRPFDYVKTKVKHLKDTHSWEAKSEYASKALAKAYSHRKYDVCNLLEQEGVSIAMNNFPHMAYSVSLTAVKTVIQHLKDSNNWDPKCDDAYKSLQIAYRLQKYDLCELLSQEGVLLTMKLFPETILSDCVITAVQLLKCTDHWDPKCDDASEALANAYKHQKYDLCDLLIKEGVSLTMKNLPSLVLSLASVKKSIQHLKNMDNWDPKSDHASKALENAYSKQKYDVCDLLVKKGVFLTMKNLPAIILNLTISLNCVEKAIQHLQDTGNWNPKCDNASEALAIAYCTLRYDVCDLLIKKGVFLTMKNLPAFTINFIRPLDCVKKGIQHLQDTGNWDPKCDHASETLANMYRHNKYDLCDLLIKEGVPLTMKNLPAITNNVLILRESVQKAMHHLKHTTKWDPKCDEASEALANAYFQKKYDVCDLLVQEGVLLTMKNLPTITFIHPVSIESVKKAIQHLKDTNNWDPKCDDASTALGYVDIALNHDVFYLLIEEGVSLTMKNFPYVVLTLASVQKAIQLLKDTNNWNPKCDNASEALANAYWLQQYKVCDLLIQLGISLTMKNLPGVISSMESVKKAIDHLKDTYNWDPKCEHASEALTRAYSEQKYDVCRLLIQLGVSLRMKNIPDVVSSLESVKKAIEHLKDTDSWDPKCDHASEAFGKAYSEKKHDVCDLLVQEGVSNLK